MSEMSSIPWFSPLTAFVATSLPDMSVCVKDEKSVWKNSDVPSLSTPVQLPAPGTMMVVSLTSSPVEPLYWLYTQLRSVSLIRKLPFGRTVKPSELGLAGAAMLMGPARTSPEEGLSLKTSRGELGYPVNAYNEPPEAARSWVPVPGRGFGRVRVSEPPAPPP